MAYLTVNQLVERYPIFTRSAFQNLLTKRQENGLWETVIKIGPRKLVIDEDKFRSWIEQHRELKED